MRRGFTLLEVLLAMALFALGITAVMGLLQMSGGLENEGRAHAELAPAIEPLLEELQREVFLLDVTGQFAGVQERRGETVPGAEEYRYDLVLDLDAQGDPVQRALVRFYRTSPDRVITEVAFLLSQRVPLDRRLELIR